jgi:hypothetical protein
MTNPPAQCLSGDELVALKFAVHRQLARWAHKGNLSRQQHARRGARVRAVRILHDKAFADGCELHAAPSEDNTNA